jgi:hypothetical protein
MLHHFMWKSSYPQRSPPYPDIGRGVSEIWIADNAQDRHRRVWLVTKYTNADRDSRCWGPRGPNGE